MYSAFQGLAVSTLHSMSYVEFFLGMIFCSFSKSLQSRQKRYQWYHPRPARFVVERHAGE
jgi:hypothetical protein